MKLLVQDYNSNLIWKEAIYKDSRFRTPDSRQTYEICSIYAIKDDSRNKTVICSACGKEIPNTPSAIRAHRNMVHKSNKCFECRYLKHSNVKTISQKYVLNDDGTYSESTKRTVNLLCGIGWRNYSINSTTAQEHCIYAACENAKFKHIEDFWTKYPNAFDEFITVDRIIDTGYKQMHKYTDYITFELKGKANLTAFVNNQGICYNFTLQHYSHTYILRYSKKYNKVWVIYSGAFRDLDVLDLSSSTQEAIIKKLSALYN